MHLNTTFDRFSNYDELVALIKNPAPEKPLRGTHIVFTGKNVCGRRKDMMAAAKSLGARVSNGTKAVRKGSLVICNSIATPGWSDYRWGGEKLKRAIQLGGVVVPIEMLVTRLREIGAEVPSSFHYSIQGELGFGDIPSRGRRGRS